MFAQGYRPQQEIEAKLGGGRTIHSGPYIHDITCVILRVHVTCTKVELFIVIHKLLCLHLPISIQSLTHYGEHQLVVQQKSGLQHLRKWLGV